MEKLKQFIAGLTIPSIILPFILFFAKALGKVELMTLPILHFVPLIWGFWNIFYFESLRNFLPSDSNMRHLLTGALLGLVLAVLGIFWLHLPTLMGFPNSLYYLPLIVVPIVYALLWRYGVKALNELLNVRDS